VNSRARSMAARSAEATFRAGRAAAILNPALKAHRVASNAAQAVQQ
jgi:hypothetical protein